MKGTLVVCGLLTLTPALVRAQVEGLQLSGGAVLITKAGKLSVGPGAIESDLGYAVRGRLRYGFGIASVAGDVQTSSQKYGADVSAPSSLSATYIGVTGALHPVSVLGLMPYGELGVGSLAFSDATLKGKGGAVATLGLGTQVGLAPRVALDLSLRLRRKSFTYAPLGRELKYDPKLFSVMLTLSL
jgi:hypothetical protein